MLHLDAVEEIFERALVDLDDDFSLSLARLGHAEHATVQALIEQAQPRAVEEEDLHRFSPLAEENEQCAAAGLPADPFGDDAAEPIEPPSKVNRLKPDEHFDAGGDHDCSSVASCRRSSTATTAARVATSTPGGTSIRARPISMRMPYRY